MRRFYTEIVVYVFSLIFHSNFEHNECESPTNSPYLFIIWMWISSFLFLSFINKQKKRCCCWCCRGSLSLIKKIKAQHAHSHNETRCWKRERKKVASQKMMIITRAKAHMLISWRTRWKKNLYFFVVAFVETNDQINKQI